MGLRSKGHPPGDVDDHSHNLLIRNLQRICVSIIINEGQMYIFQAYALLI